MAKFVQGEYVTLVNDNYKFRQAGYLTTPATGDYATYALVIGGGSRYRSEGRLEKVLPLQIRKGAK